MNYEVKNKKRNIFYQIMFATGMGLIIWEIFVFRKTVMPISFPLAMIIGMGSVAFLFDVKKYANTYNLKGVKLYFFAFMQNTVSWGFIACSILILSNFYLSRGEITNKKYKIIERSSMAGHRLNRSERKPLVRIDYEGERKELVFSHWYFSKINEYNYVNISTKKGFIYWDIIVNQELEP